MKRTTSLNTYFLER